ncbi:MAG: CDP-diacylglycerol--serine O-phosphatidyltransferase [Gammaproteobacteria bacterium]|nr:CDP-diacylglycerol--serine O-phosphatidyltransferase [Gammaproteobacteria bacterium]
MPLKPKFPLPPGAPDIRRRGIYILPNLFTTAGLFAGFYSIIEATAGRFETAAGAIFVAMVMDGLDGRIARMTGTSSDFGKEYDSLADVICFGLTPALVMFEWSLSGAGKFGWLAAFVYVASAALRLARFNTQKVSGKRYFHGLPCPMAAALMAAFVWVVERYGISGFEVKIFSVTLTLALGLAMVSGIRYRSFKDLDLKGKVPFVAVVGVVAVYALISFDPPRVLFACSLIYALSGPVIHLLIGRKRLGGKPRPPQG